MSAREQGKVVTYSGLIIVLAVYGYFGGLAAVALGTVLTLGWAVVMVVGGRR